jgi:lipopolysaccharide export system permease protein
VSVLSRYTVREVLSHLAGVLGVVLAIFLVRRFGSLLDEAADGSLPTEVILRLLGLRTVVALPSLVPVALYLSVVLALGRLYRDSEMTALAGCGVGPARVRGPVVVLALVVAVVVAGLSFGARPWAAARFDRVRDRAASTLDVGRMGPGRFYEASTGDGEQIVFAERRSRDDARALENVFVQQRQGEHLSIFLARRALEQRDPDETSRVLRLLDGYRYDLDGGADDVQITRYGEFAIRTSLSGTDREPQRGRSNLALLASPDPRDRAEFEWRLAMPVSTVLLVVLAVPLSPVRPRHGKYANFFLAVVLYVVYRQLLGAAKNWVADGLLAPLPWVWIVHGACLVAACGLLLRERRP